MDAADRLPGDRFDAIIVDEGQDFEEEWWAALTSLLADPDDGILYIFYDDNQRLYKRNAAFPITGPPVHLTRNCRNTKQIHEAVMMFHESPTPPECIGPDGESPKSLETTGDGRRDVEDYIDQLVGKQKVRPGDIAILTRRSRDRSAWSNPPDRPLWSATWDLAACADKVVVSSIHAFKGLERPVVIVCEIGDVDPEEEASLLYVAFSRAREVLVVAGLRR
jgi:superfamily I DNA/RNA helicase